MKTFAFLILILPLSLWAEPKLVGGGFGAGPGSEIRDLAARPDGSIVACGTLGGKSPIPKAGKTEHLFTGQHDTGIRGFVAEFSADLSRLKWISVFPTDSIQPTRMALGKDGSIAIGGKHLGQLADLDSKKENWTKSTGALAKLSPDGNQVLWVSPTGPNQEAVTGIDVDDQGRVYFMAGSRVRSAANYLLRKNGKTGANEPWEKTGWCVYLHRNQEALKAEGQYIAFYDKARNQSEDGFGFDYDGEGGWGPVGFSLQGFRIGGNVRVLPDGDVLVSSGLQYDFRVNERVAPKPKAARPKSELDSLLDGDAKKPKLEEKPEKITNPKQKEESGPIRKGKSFPAFDYFLARYSPDGDLRWSTNLYQSGDSVHTPDQKPIDLAYDAGSDTIYTLVKQHGSNIYRFKGQLVGDTGNLMISWLGKVDAKTGALAEGWYFQNNRLGDFGPNGIPQSPPYPKLAGNALRRVAIGPGGSIYLAGSGGAQTWTTDNALQAWPKDQAGGAQGVLVELSRDLEKVRRATCLFVDAEETFAPHGLVVTEKGIILAGRGSFGGELAKKATQPNWSERKATSGCLLFAILN